jgi:Uma2 family endonuclease
MSRSLPDAEIDYPDTDGKPMAETDFQRDYLTYAVESLRLYFRDRPDVYVSGNLLIYYVEGDPRASVAPDCFVVFGVPAHDRPIYKIWEEDGIVPAFALEITSKSTRAEDCGTKRGLYAYLGVREYWQYDPTGDYLEPPLRGFRLVGEEYQAIPRPHPFGVDFALPSTVLGLDLQLRAGQLRFRDPVTGHVLPTYGELEAARQAAEAARQAAEAARVEAEQRARQEAEQRRVLEARLAALEARLDPEAKRAEH